MSQESFDKSKQKIIAIISALIPDAKIYLYGSRARGTAHEWSDIDIALDANHALFRSDIGELNEIMASLSIPHKVSIVDIHAIPETLKNAILRDKVIWKS